MSDNSNIKPPVNKPTTEMELLGTVLLFPNAAGIAIQGKLNDIDFSMDVHKHIWKTIDTLYAKNVGVTIGAVSDALQNDKAFQAVGGTKYLADLTGAAIGPEFINGEIRELKECTLRRTLISRAKQLASNATNTEELVEVLSQLQDMTNKADQYYANGEYTNVENDAIAEYIKTAYANELDAFSKINLKSNFKYLDKVLGGNFYPGMYTLAATSSLGKTTLTGQIADNIAKQKVPVLYFSIEMSAMELVSKSIARIIDQEAGVQDEATSNNHITAPADYQYKITSLRIRQHWKPGMTKGDWTGDEEDNLALKDSDVTKINHAFDTYKKTIAPYMYVTGANFQCDINSIISRISNFIKKEKTKPFVVIDYLQIIQKPKNFRGTDQQHIDECVTSLERFAKQQQITIFVISSVNRQSYLSPISFESLKTSGSIEFSSDVVLAMDLEVLNKQVDTLDDDKKNATRKLIDEAKNACPREICVRTLKNRYGSGGSTSFIYNPVCEHFINVQTIEDAVEDFKANSKSFTSKMNSGSFKK